MGWPPSAALPWQRADPRHLRVHTCRCHLRQPRYSHFLPSCFSLSLLLRPSAANVVSLAPLGTRRWVSVLTPAAAAVYRCKKTACWETIPEEPAVEARSWEIVGEGRSLRHVRFWMWRSQIVTTMVFAEPPMGRRNEPVTGRRCPREPPRVASEAPMAACSASERWVAKDVDQHTSRGKKQHQDCPCHHRWSTPLQLSWLSIVATILLF